MKTHIKKKTRISNKDNLVLLYSNKYDLSEFNLSIQEKNYISKKLKENKKIIVINQYSRFLFIVNIEQHKEKNIHLEKCRILGDQLLSKIKDLNNIVLVNSLEKKDDAISFAEGMALANYSFNKHKTLQENPSLNTIYFFCKKTSQKDINELQNIIDAVYLTRNLVNEPFSHLTAQDLAKEAVDSAKKFGIKSTVFNKKEIEKMKMGGLLAVNRGSLDEPTFTVLEWSPKNSKNKKPIVLVGKGIVFDTGGLSLKPTTNSMDIMKVDMGGAGTVIGVMQAIASNNLPVSVKGLIPATDNRPSGNAYAPGDVVKMHSGMTVEVLNTDAEGRMILADALSYAKKFNPSLVIDLATLTGSAASTIGHFGIVSMHNMAEKEHCNLKKYGEYTHERLAELPFWSDYDDLIKSDIADIKNIGGPQAGAITAGKFLCRFTDYPWIHLDIAGASYTPKKYGYRGKGATGMGVRLLYHFLKSLT